MKKFYFLFLITFLFTPFLTSAFSLQSGPEVRFEGDSIVEENVYLVGGSVFFDKTFEDDALILSGKSFINGAIFGDLQVISGESFIDGEVFGDARIISGESTISANTNEDLVVLAGKVNSDEQAIFNGETLIVAGEVNLKGQVLDDIKIIAGKVNIDAEILGDVEITAQQVSVGENADIKGEFVYFSPKRAQIHYDSTFTNRPVYNQIESINENELVKKTILSFINFWAVIKFLAAMFTAFILVFVFRMFSQRTSSLAIDKMGKSFLIGLFSILLVPIIILILMASLFGIPIAGIIFLIYIVIAILTAPVSGIILGYYIQRLIKKKKKVEIDFNSTALGIIILTFLYFIPVLGAILKAFFFILAFGAMILYISEVVTIKKQKS